MKYKVKNMFIYMILFLFLFYILKSVWFGTVIYKIVVDFFGTIFVKLYFYVFEIIIRCLYSINKYLLLNIILNAILALLFTKYSISMITRNKNIVKNIYNSKGKKEYLKKLQIKLGKRVLNVLKDELVFVYATIYAYGQASTGIKMNILHGVVLENTFVSHLGGGSIQSGGGGMTLGYKILVLFFLICFFKSYIFQDFKNIIIWIKKFFQRERELKEKSI